APPERRRLLVVLDRLGGLAEVLVGHPEGVPHVRPALVAAPLVLRDQGAHQVLVDGAAGVARGGRVRAPTGTAARGLGRPGRPAASGAAGARSRLPSAQWASASSSRASTSSGRRATRRASTCCARCGWPERRAATACASSALRLSPGPRLATARRAASSAG